MNHKLFARQPQVSLRRAIVIALTAMTLLFGAAAPRALTHVTTTTSHAATAQLISPKEPCSGAQAGCAPKYQ